MGRTLVCRASPLGPLPVPQPRGGRGRRGAAASLVGGGRGWGRAEAVEILAPRAPLGALPRRQGRRLNQGPPNMPLVRALQVEKARGDWEEEGSAVGDQAPSSQAGLLKKHVGCLSPPTFGLSFPSIQGNCVGGRSKTKQ